jgi:hypothetical protein
MKDTLVLREDKMLVFVSLPSRLANCIIHVPYTQGWQGFQALGRPLIALDFPASRDQEFEPVVLSGRRLYRPSVDERLLSIFVCS